MNPLCGWTTCKSHDTVQYSFQLVCLDNQRNGTVAPSSREIQVEGHWAESIPQIETSPVLYINAPTYNFIRCGLPVVSSCITCVGDNPVLTDDSWLWLITFFILISSRSGALWFNWVLLTRVECRNPRILKHTWKQWVLYETVEIHCYRATSRGSLSPQDCDPYLDGPNCTWHMCQLRHFWSYCWGYT